MNEMPEHIKRKVLMFFLETSVPRILKAKKEKEEAK